MTISRTAPFMKDDQLRVAAKSSCTTDSSGSGKTGCDNNAEFIGIMTPSFTASCEQNGNAPSSKVNANAGALTDESTYE